MTNATENTATRNNATATVNAEEFSHVMRMDTWTTNGSTRPSKAARRARVQNRKFVRNNG